MTEKLPDYQKVSDALHTLYAIGEASETHGLLCALFSSNVVLHQEAWLDSMLSKHLEGEDSTCKQAQKVLGELFNCTKSMFATDQFALQLLLPTDEASFELRLEALVGWCQGYLAGLNRMGLNLQSLSADVSDATEDLNKIACLDYSQEAADESSENAYAELIEYVRVAVMALYSELQSKFTLQRPKHAGVH